MQRKQWTFKLIVLILALYICTPQIAEGGVIGTTLKGAGKIYYSIVNPMESFIISNNVVEEQHVLPRSQGGASSVLIPYYNHCASDRAWEKLHIDRDNRHDNFLIRLLTLGNEGALVDLNNAYMLGRTMIPYAMFCFDYRSSRSTNWHFLSTEMDGTAVLVYAVSWIVHQPAKFIRQIAYIIHKQPPWYAIFDVILNVVSLVLEVIFLCIGTILGVILGTIFHPINTLCSIPGAIYFLGVSLVTCVIDLFTACYHLIFN